MAVTSEPTNEVARNVDNCPLDRETVSRKTLVAPCAPPPPLPEPLVVAEPSIEAPAAAEDEIPAGEEAPALKEGTTTSTDVLGALPASVVRGDG